MASPTMIALNKDPFEKSRRRMVQEQLLPRGISNPRVLAAMNNVPRHLFVEDALQSQAYGDFTLPIGEGQTISQPYIVALMTEALQLEGHEKVLEIGTGCGYQTTVLAQLCDTVYSVERLKPLYIKTRRRFDQLHVLNVLTKIDDGTLGWPEHGPYDAIIVTAAGPDVPQALIEQLAAGGTMVIPAGQRESQELLMVKKQNGVVQTKVIERVRFVSLIGAQGWTG